MKNSFLNNAVAPILAISYTTFSFLIYYMVLTKQVSATENVTFLILNSITNIAMLIVGYYFGSSAGSKAKQDALDKMADNTTSTTSTTSQTQTNEALSDDNNN